MLHGPSLSTICNFYPDSFDPVGHGADICSILGSLDSYRKLMCWVSFILRSRCREFPISWFFQWVGSILQPKVVFVIVTHWSLFQPDHKYILLHCKLCGLCPCGVAWYHAGWCLGVTVDHHGCLGDLESLFVHIPSPLSVLPLLFHTSTKPVQYSLLAIIVKPAGVNVA